MNTPSGPAAVSWSELKDELFDAGDQADIAARADVLRAEVRAHRLAEVRKRQQATQTERAARMGVSQSRVSDIERGWSISTMVPASPYVKIRGGPIRWRRPGSRLPSPRVWARWDR
jgi:predicted transcriptional regulator